MLVSYRRFIGKILPLLLFAWTAKSEIPALTGDAIIQQAVQRAERARSGQPLPAYKYTKLNVTEELDSKGKVRDRKERLFEVNFSGTATSVKLVGVNGHAPAPADVKSTAENQSNVHQFFGQPSSGGDNRESFFTSDIAAHFDFTLVDQCLVSGRRTYQVSFQPKATQPPAHRILDRLLNQISGTLWIDAEEFELARAELKLGSEVDFLGGVIGCLRKLVYSITRVRLSEGVWLHSSSSGDFEGRKLLEPLRIKTRSECSNFQLLGGAK